jgi:hypothetical protein
MSPKEKAEELVKKYLLKVKIDTRTVGESNKTITNGQITLQTAIHCALIAVDEIIESKPYRFVPFLDYTDCTVLESNIKYWQEVKQEIYKI